MQMFEVWPLIAVWLIISVLGRDVDRIQKVGEVLLSIYRVQRFPISEESFAAMHNIPNEFSPRCISVLLRGPFFMT